MTDQPHEEPGEEPQRTRFVEPPPAEPEPPVASAPLSTPDAEPERTSEVAVPPAEPPVPSEPPVASAPVDAPVEEPERTQGGGTGLLTAAAVVLTVVCAVLVVLVVGDLRGQRNADYDAQASPALAAAKKAATEVLAYDYRTLEPGFQKALALTTDVDRDCKAKADRTSSAYDPNAKCFRTEFALTHEKVVVDLATRYKAVVTADVGAAGVVGVAGDRVTVLVYVNQQSTNTQAANPKITQDRVEMVMQKVKGHWLVAGITAL